MDKREKEALEELLTKIPEEDLKKAATQLSSESLEKLSGGIFGGLFSWLGSKLGFGVSSDEREPSNPESANKDFGVAYTSNDQIRNAYLNGEIKGIRNLKKAYVSLHKSFKGSTQDVLVILGL